jgi:hypothetical protein
LRFGAIFADRKLHTLAWHHDPGNEGSDGIVVPPTILIKQESVPRENIPTLL